MIFPILNRFLPPGLAPATYFLFVVNLFVFFFTLAKYGSSQSQIDGLFDDQRFLYAQGTLFAQMIEKTPDRFSPLLYKLAVRSLDGDRESSENLGGFALRNVIFMKEALEFSYRGDEIAYKGWKQKFQKLLYVQQGHPSFQWGLTFQNAKKIRQWISYQFMHSGGFHLFWNMIWLLLFAGFLERAIGSSLVIIAYLSSGIAGAAFFSVFSGFTSSPLVGASAAVSGLVGLVAVLCWREKVDFAYLFLLDREHAGVRPLPGWLVLVIFAIPDLAGILSAVSDMNSVAHWAHLGGMLWGGLLGAGLHAGWLVRDVEQQHQ